MCIGLSKIVRRFIVKDPFYEKGSLVITNGMPSDKFYIVRSGWLKTFVVTYHGMQRTIRFVVPGEAVLLNLLPEEPVDYNLQALTDTCLAIGNNRLLLEQLWNQPNLLEEVNRYLEAGHREARRNMLFLGVGPAEIRVASLLLILFLKLRKVAPFNGDNLNIPLSQTEISEACGLTNVHVNRVLGDLRDKGVLQFKLGSLQILGARELLEMSMLDVKAAIADSEILTNFKRGCPR